MVDLVAAIDDRRTVSLTYAKDAGAGERVCHPHIIYESSAGNTCLDAYQLEGYSSRGGLPSWRIFYLDEITGLTVSDTCFPSPAAGYNPRNRARYVRILHQL